MSAGAGQQVEGGKEKEEEETTAAASAVAGTRVAETAPGHVVDAIRKWEIFMRHTVV